MILADETHAALTGTLLGALHNLVGSNDLAGITEVQPDVDNDGNFEGSIAVTAHGQRFQIVIVPSPLEISAPS